MRAARAYFLVSVLASLAPGEVASAQTAATSPAPADQPGVASASPDAAEPGARPRVRRDRGISDNLASTLAASMPKFNPPPKPKPEDEDVDAREVDKPKNGIIRLPKYTVQEKRPPVFTQKDLLTSTGRADLALRRHAGLGFGPLAFLNRPIGAEMLYEEERLGNISDLKDTARTIGTTDAAEGAYIKRVTDQTYMRSSGFGYESGPGARH